MIVMFFVNSVVNILCGACVCHVLDRVKGYGGITYIYLETSSINLIVGMSRRT